MNSYIVSTFSTPIGWLEVRYDEHFVHNAVFVEQKTYQPSDNKTSRLIANEIDAYFRNPHHRFKLSLKPHGTIYQQRVWNELLVIPVGRTLTYGELANTLQSSPRAIGQACKKNPLALFIPCHRVVGKANQGGYMGLTTALHYKIDLLNHETITL